jgi:hypothetical protein
VFLIAAFFFFTRGENAMDESGLDPVDCSDTTTAVVVVTIATEFVLHHSLAHFSSVFFEMPYKTGTFSPLDIDLGLGG